jgi:hypothetical protein
MKMIITWCTVGFHKWVYNEQKDKRHCVKCPKKMILDTDEYSQLNYEHFWDDDEENDEKA